jgi:hypothetical protein
MAVTSADDTVRHNVMALLRHNMSTASSADSEAPKAERLIAESTAYRPAGHLL